MRPRERTRVPCSAPFVAGLVVAALAALLAPPPAAAQVRIVDPRLPREAGEADPWRTVLQRAEDAARRRRHSGETLWIVWTGGEPHVALSEVRRDHHALTVSAADRYTVRLDDGGGDLVDHVQGWFAPLPRVDRGAPKDAMAALEDKYEVSLAGQDRLLDRPCTRVEVRRRADGSLRERLWIDESTGLLLRRDSYEGDQRLRLFAYLSLDLQPATAARAGTRASRAKERDALRLRDTSATPVEEAALAALRLGGWVVPPSLPGGYEPVAAYAVDGSEGQPLHVVYRDGLYTVSLFQQRGHPDWESLPEGAEPAADVEQPAYEWPGALPRRLVWEADGATFSLVGDAPPAEFAAIVDALPRPAAPRVTARLRRGLSRLWQWVAP